MTLTEAILHAEEVAKEKEEEAQDLEYSKLDWKDESNQCKKCAEEHRQLAEWLKDYKRLLKQENVLDKIRAEIEQNITETNNLLKDGHDERVFGFVCGCEEVLKIIDKYAESEKEI